MKTPQPTKKGSMNTPCTECNKLGKPCSKEHSGKLSTPQPTTVQNEPQLSAEQYKKYAVRFCNCNEGQFSKMATHSQSCDFIQGSFVDHQEQMHFLATALEEQEEKHRDRRTKWAFKTVDMVDQARQDERNKVIEEVLSWLVDEEISLEMATGKHGKEFVLIEMNRNKLRAELRTKLNQLKGDDLCNKKPTLI